MNPIRQSIYRHYRLARHSLGISFGVSRRVLVATADAFVLVLSKISKMY